jgi:hypothetical protein
MLFSHRPLYSLTSLCNFSMYEKVDEILVPRANGSTQIDDLENWVLKRISYPKKDLEG